MVKIVNLKDTVIGDWIETQTTVRDDNGDIVDVAGSTSLMTIKKNINDTDAQALSQVSGSLFTDGSDGKLEYVTPGTDTVNATSGTYFYDIQVVLVSGRKFTVNKGFINFLDEITIS